MGQNESCCNCCYQAQRSTDGSYFSIDPSANPFVCQECLTSLSAVKPWESMADCSGMSWPRLCNRLNDTVLHDSIHVLDQSTMADETLNETMGGRPDEERLGHKHPFMQARNF